jgi:hypothetical protein
VRVYVPSTLPGLRELSAHAELRADPLLAYAVTPALREWYTSGDEEELEYAAMTDAARASLRMLDADPAAPRRRVVIAVDVPTEQVSGAPRIDRAAVLVRSPVPLRVVAAVHVDLPEAEPAVAAAAAAVAKADLGDDDSGFLVDAVEDYELAWYATQEIADLLG